MDRKGLLSIIFSLMLFGSVILAMGAYEQTPTKSVTESMESRIYKVEFDEPVDILNHTVDEIEVFYENKTIFLHLYDEGDIQSVDVNNVNNITFDNKQSIEVLYPKEDTQPISSSYEEEEFNNVEKLEINSGGIRITHQKKNYTSFICGIFFMCFIMGIIGLTGLSALPEEDNSTIK